MKSIKNNESRLKRMKEKREVGYFERKRPDFFNSSARTRTTQQTWKKLGSSAILRFFFKKTAFSYSNTYKKRHYLVNILTVNRQVIQTTFSWDSLRTVSTKKVACLCSKPQSRNHLKLGKYTFSAELSSERGEKEVLANSNQPTAPPSTKSHVSYCAARARRREKMAAEDTSRTTGWLLLQSVLVSAVDSCHCRLRLSHQGTQTNLCVLLCVYVGVQRRELLLLPVIILRRCAEWFYLCIRQHSRFYSRHATRKSASMNDACTARCLQRVLGLHAKKDTSRTTKIIFGYQSTVSPELADEVEHRSVLPHPPRGSGGCWAFYGAPLFICLSKLSLCKVFNTNALTPSLHFS